MTAAAPALAVRKKNRVGEKNEDVDVLAERGEKKKAGLRLGLTRALPALARCEKRQMLILNWDGDAHGARGCRTKCWRGPQTRGRCSERCCWPPLKKN